MPSGTKPGTRGYCPSQPRPESRDPQSPPAALEDPRGFSVPPNLAYLRLACDCLRGYSATLPGSQSVRPRCSRSPSPPQRPRALLSLPSPALTSRTALRGGGGGGAGTLASAHPEPPLGPSSGCCHEPTLSDSGDVCRGGGGRGVEKEAAGALEHSHRSPGQGIKGPDKNQRQGCAGAGTGAFFHAQAGQSAQKKLCGSLSCHIHKVAQEDMNEVCGCAPRKTLGTRADTCISPRSIVPLYRLIQGQNAAGRLELWAPSGEKETGERGQR